jgi:pyrroloquinoline quinone biosynthesis protein D
MPRLASHVRRQIDRVTGAALLLYPEGAVELSETADAIVQLCDGSRTVEEIAAALAAEYDGVLRPDVDACIDALAQRGLLVA